MMNFAHEWRNQLVISAEQIIDALVLVAFAVIWMATLYFNSK